MSDRATHGTDVPSPAALEHERNLLALARIMSSGHGESEEANRLRDTMLDTWGSLSALDKGFLDELSGDLYMLDQTELLDLERIDPEDIDARIQVAWNTRQYESILALLRRRPETYPEDKAAFIRARCWARLGYQNAGLAFLVHASKLRPDNGSYTYLMLQETVDLGHFDEAVARATAIARQEDASARSLLAAAYVLNRADQRAKATTSPDYIITLLERAIELETALPPRERLNSAIVQAYVEKGICHELQGRDDLAEVAFSEALRFDPENDPALTARAFARLSKDPERAAEDFRLAAARRTPLVWPYLYLAHSYLETESYDACIETCELGLERAQSQEHRANLYEWMAIANAALSAPPRRVEELFELAIANAPFNLRIHRNRELSRAAYADEGRIVSWEVANDTTAVQGQKQFVLSLPRLAA